MSNIYYWDILKTGFKKFATMSVFEDLQLPQVSLNFNTSSAADSGGGPGGLVPPKI